MKSPSAAVDSFSSLFKRLKRLSDAINSMTIYLVVILMLSMTLIVLSQVFFRFVLNNSLTWAEEISRYLMIWICFLGASIACKYGEHIRVNFIRDRFPSNLQPYISILIDVFILVFLYFCVLKSFTLTKFVIHQKSAAARISMAWAYSSVPAGCSLMALHICSGIVDQAKTIVANIRK